MNVAARGDGDGFARAHRSRRMQCIQMDYLCGRLGRERLGMTGHSDRHQFGSGTGHWLNDGECGCRNHSIERDEPMDQRSKRGGHSDQISQRETRSVRRSNGVDARLKRLLYLGDGPGELDPSPAGGKRRYLEAFTLQPGDNDGDIRG